MCACVRASLYIIYDTIVMYIENPLRFFSATVFVLCLARVI